MECLQAAGVGAAAVRRASELLTEPGFVERGYWAALERQFIGETVSKHALAIQRRACFY